MHGNDPILIFTTKVSRCANGYHLKIRKKDVELLNLKGKMVLLHVYAIDSDRGTKVQDPFDALVTE